MKLTPGNEILKLDEWDALAIETTRFTPREKSRKYLLISFLFRLSRGDDNYKKKKKKQEKRKNDMMYFIALNLTENNYFKEVFNSESFLTSDDRRLFSSQNYRGDLARYSVPRI